MRRTRRILRLVAAASLPALAACASAPTHFYTLRPGQDVAARSEGPAAPAPFLIDVQPVAVPAQVDQSELLVRHTEQRVAVLDNERWAAPLAAELRGAFAAELVAELGALDVYGLPHPPAKPVYRIQIDVRMFDSWPGHHAQIQADWSVRGASEGSVITCASNASEEVGPGYDALVQGHQRAIARIAGEIATAVRGIGAGSAATCPR